MNKYTVLVEDQEAVHLEAFSWKLELLDELNARPVISFRGATNELKAWFDSKFVRGVISEPKLDA
jgi:hypothetical protein